MNENIDHMWLVPMSAEVTMFFHEFTSSLDIAKSQERDRIIQVITEHAYVSAIDLNELEVLIALIKGEQK